MAASVITNERVFRARSSAVLLILLATTAAAGLRPARCLGEEPQSFEPGDISIGDPISLPFAGPRTNPAAAVPAHPTDVPPTATPAQAAAAPGALAAPAADLTPIRERMAPLAPRHPPSPPAAASTAAPASSAVAGQGWLGLAVAESSVAGRWVVATVAPVGPAAAAGILPGDEVRGINGLPLRNADEVSQAMTAITPGQVVGMAIARGEQVRDVQLTATARPSATPFAAAPSVAQPTPPPAAHPAAPPAAPPAATPFAAAPPMAASPPRFAAGPPSADPATQVPLPGAVRSAPAHSQPAAAVGGRTALGVRTVPVDEGLQSRFRLPAASGAYVIGVVQDLPASKAGVPPGSVIVSLDARPVRSPDELTQLVTRGPVGRPVTLEYVLPGGASQQANVMLQTLEKPLEEALLGPDQPTATGIPSLEPSLEATTARRPVSRPDVGAVAALRDEIRWLRARLSALEQRLDAESR